MGFQGRKRLFSVSLYMTDQIQSTAFVDGPGGGVVYWQLKKTRKLQVIVMKCCSFGSLNMDHMYRVHAFLSPGETRPAQSVSHVCGGKGLNQAIALASAGARVFQAGNVGDDADGQRLIAALTERGVDASLVRRLPGVDCGHAIIQVADNGENCILLFAGANFGVDEEQIEAALGHFEAGDLLVMQNEINLLPRIMRAAKARGLRIAFNPSPFNERVTPELITLSDILFVNEVEARQLIPEAADDDDAGRLLHAKWPHLLLVQTLGSRGAVAYDGDACLRQPAIPVQAVDTTGAGDTFTGFFLAAWTRGEPLQICLRQAAQAAALCVSRMGTSAAIPTLEEVQRMA